MSNGWTGGQYSVYRMVLAAAIATHFGVGGWIFAVPVALGAGDRLAALVFVAGAALSLAIAPSSVTSGGVFATALVALHFATPGRPYGSWGARNRPDPGAGWWLPARVQLAARVLALIALISVFRELAPPVAIWIPLLLLAFDPGSVPAKRDGAPVRLYYDGECGLCHAAVRFVLAEDRGGAGFRFAPLASDSFARVAAPEARAALPDSLVLALHDGGLLVRSAATLEIGERLGGLWRIGARIARLVPEAWRDRAYDAIARNRKRFARKPQDACPLLSPELRARFE
jgi:predicted DCC family thiol-disulfide oxidoreductase YuxK